MKLLALGTLVVLAASSQATLIDFSTLTPGVTLGSQYPGVTFAAGTGGLIVPNPVATTQGFAPNTDMTIVVANGGDTGVVSAPMSGNMLHSFNGWLGETGDAVFTITFATAITDFSADFGGIANVGSTAIYAYDGSGTLLGSDVATVLNNDTLSLTGLVGATQVAVTMGDFSDWVGMDNVNYRNSTVPEPASLAVLGLGAAAFLRRRRKA